MAVIIVPGLFVFVPGVFWCNFLKSRFYIVIDKARLIFGRRYAGGRADIKKCNGTINYFGLCDSFSNLVGYIYDIAVSTGLDFELFCFDHGRQDKGLDDFLQVLGM